MIKVEHYQQREKEDVFKVTHEDGSVTYDTRNRSAEYSAKEIEEEYNS